MMDGMGWLMGSGILLWILVIVVLMLAAAALIKYLNWASRGCANRRRGPTESRCARTREARRETRARRRTQLAPSSLVLCRATNQDGRMTAS